MSLVSVVARNAMLIRRIVLASSISLIPVVVAASPPSYSNKQVDLIQPDHPNSDCFYFTLQGVSVADPAINASAWFAVDRTTHKGANQLYATLLTAKASGLLWSTCGHQALRCVAMRV